MQDSLAQDDRLLLFSQSLCTLNLLEDFLQKKTVAGTQVALPMADYEIRIYCRQFLMSLYLALFFFI